jgi:predicted dehydrogenase
MYEVGLIGIGSIAEGYGKPEDPNSYCHIAGIIHSPGVELAAVADLSEERRDNFKAKWGALLPPDYRSYASAAAMLAAETLDIVAVCVRGPHHFAVMNEVLAAGPQAIFLEKPPTCSLAEMDAMVAVARDKRIPITVSYSRHWAPHVLRLQELVQGGLIGEVQQVVGYCGHSFLSFASHTTDLICQFAGYGPTAVSARGHVPEGDVPEGYEPEPAVDTMTIEFDNGVLGTQIGVGGEHGTFYCDVIGTEGLVRAGIYIPPFARTKEGPVDLAALGMPENASVFTVAYNQIAAYLDGGPKPHCTDEEWMAVHEIGFAGIESVLTDRRVTLPNAGRERKVFANG